MPTPEQIADAMRLLGYDPEKVQSLIVTPASVVAISTDYPEPHNPPQEVPNGN